MFVDASGRRGRTPRRFGWAVTIVCACYATTVAASLVGGDSGAPFLRIPGVTEGTAEAAESEREEAEAVTEAERPTWEPTIPNGTMPSDRGRVAGVVPPSATADPDEPVGRVAPVGEGDVSDDRDEDGAVADTAPAQPAPGATLSGGGAGTPPADPQNENENETGTEDEADPPADEPAGSGNPVDGLLGGLLGLPPLLVGRPAPPGTGSPPYPVEPVAISPALRW